MVIWVKDSDLEDFLPLIPYDMQDEVQSGEWLCLGALADPVASDDDGGGEKVAAGVLLFSANEGLSFGEVPLTMIQLRWIYVAPSYRRMGIGNELMEAFSDVVKDNPADGILCDIPFGSEYDLAEEFLSDWGFEFEVIESPEVVISRMDGYYYKKQDNMKKSSNQLSPNNGVRPLKNVPANAFRKALHEIISKTPTPYYEGISDDPTIYDGEVSCAVMKNGVVSSLMLFEKLSETRFQMVIMSSLAANPAVELRDLIIYSAAVLYVKLPPETEVHINLGSERSMSLFSYFFPEKELMLIRRGYFS